MRMLRSLVCAGLAMIALSLCANMPATAAVTLDTHVVVQPMTGLDQPAFASVAIVHQDAAVLPSEAPTISSFSDVRSSAGNVSPSIVDLSIAVSAYRHIDPDITG